jgi:hypothetical protein
MGCFMKKSTVSDPNQLSLFDLLIGGTDKKTSGAEVIYRYA